jgi:hypothetical protein
MAWWPQRPRSRIEVKLDALNEFCRYSIGPKIAGIESDLRGIYQQGRQIMGKVADLERELGEVNDATNGLADRVGSLAAELKAVKEALETRGQDDARIEAVVTGLDQVEQRLRGIGNPDAPPVEETPDEPAPDPDADPA